MILVCGGIKGGIGKSTVAINMAIIRASEGKDVLLIDADDQESASDFTIMRNETFSDKRGAGYTAVKLHGAAVRTDVLKLATKYDDVVIDVGERDTVGQRAALSVANVYVVPFLPASFDVWSLEKVGTLIEEAKAFNEQLYACCMLNRADSQGKENAEAANIAQSIPHMIYLDTPLGNRKAFRNAAAQGLAVTELKPQDPKAVKEIMTLYKHLFNL